MNIIEIAREAGFKVDWQHADVAEIKAQRYVAFANAVIAARDAELIEGVGEPVYGSDTIQLYTAAQVAAAVAIGKYALNADRYARERRIAELESERDMWKATAEAVVDFEKAQMRLRIATLESTLEVALEALEERTSIGTADCKTLIKQIKEVLHAD